MLKQLDVPHPFSLDALCARLSAQRGRPLHLHALPPQAASAGACGLWLATHTDDHIFFERRTARAHQEHIVLHEIAHMLFDHHSVADGELGTVSALLSDLSPRLVNRLLARTDYTTWQEQEAEMLASLIRTSERQPAAAQPSGALQELEAALGVEAWHVR
ncbi:hypothetical protein ACIGXM_33295 [Kitasatospora sp. NPDC052896]|uniref:hypothetical protein n=1 Tax=Kitasatospora sp. NPDC052896 TaxID=3364061 RepID=UPI0037C7203A